MKNTTCVSHIVSLALRGVAPAPRAMSIGGVPMGSIRERGPARGREE